MISSTGGNAYRTRNFQPGDYDQVMTLWERVRLPVKPKGRDERLRIFTEIKNRRARFLITERDSRIIATILGTHDGRKGWINRLAVDPEHRRQGIAAALLERIENFFIHEGIEIFACLIEGENPESATFFSAAGYAHHPHITYYTKRLRGDI